MRDHQSGLPHWRVPEALRLRKRVSFEATAPVQASTLRALGKAAAHRIHEASKIVVCVSSAKCTSVQACVGTACSLIRRQMVADCKDRGRSRGLARHRFLEDTASKTPGGLLRGANSGHANQCRRRATRERVAKRRERGSCRNNGVDRHAHCELLVVAIRKADRVLWAFDLVKERLVVLSP